MTAKALLVEGRYLQREMIDIAPLLARTRAARAAEFARERNEVDQRSAGAKLDEADIVLALLRRAAQRSHIERKTAFEVRDAQHHVIDGEELERNHFQCRSICAATTRS